MLSFTTHTAKVSGGNCVLDIKGYGLNSICVKVNCVGVGDGEG